MTYSEKLKDPRWQKKRLKLLEAANWSCSFCDEQSKTLHVHHRYYKRGLMPWEYPDYAYSVLCDSCHEREQVEMEASHETLAMNPSLQACLAFGNEDIIDAIVSMVVIIRKVEETSFQKGVDYGFENAKFANAIKLSPLADIK